MASVQTCGKPQRRRPLQLRAGDLDGEDVVRRFDGDRRDQRQSHVAGGDAPQPGSLQDRLEHADRRGLAVGSGDTEPRRRSGGPQPPGQLGFADDVDTGPGGGRHQWLVGPETGRGHDQVGGQWRHRVAEPDLGAAFPQPSGDQPLRLTVAVGHDRDVGPSLEQDIGHGNTGHPEPGDDRAQPVVPHRHVRARNAA
jgi:hypothetical protein